MVQTRPIQASACWDVVGGRPGLLSPVICGLRASPERNDTAPSRRHDVYEEGFAWADGRNGTDNHHHMYEKCFSARGLEDGPAAGRLHACCGLVLGAIDLRSGEGDAHHRFGKGS
jgi:hypothetical protein